MAWRMRRRLKLPSFQVALRGGGVGRAIHVLEMDSWAQAGRYVGSSDFNNHYLFFPLTSFDTRWRKTYKAVVVSLKWVYMPLNERQLLQHGLKFIQVYWNWAALQCSPMPEAQCCILCLLADSCIQCAPWAYFCQNWVGEVHSKINFFHSGEVWEVCAMALSCFSFVYSIVHISIVLPGLSLQTNCRVQSGCRCPSTAWVFILPFNSSYLLGWKW